MGGLEISMGSFAVSESGTFEAIRYPDLFFFCIAEKEIEIVYDLAQRVLQYENMLVEASDICGGLDRYPSSVGSK